MFQGKFAIITPALIAGAFAERVSFKGYVVFIALWGLLVYNPLCHWVWASDGFLFNMGAMGPLILQVEPLFILHQVLVDWLPLFILVPAVVIRKIALAPATWL